MTFLTFKQIKELEDLAQQLKIIAEKDSEAFKQAMLNALKYSSSHYQITCMTEEAMKCDNTNK